MALVPLPHAIQELPALGLSFLASLLLCIFLAAIGLQLSRRGRDAASPAKGSRSPEAQWVSASPLERGNARATRVGAHESAEDCWTRGDGRYKHCGLRKDVFSIASPPVYSVTNIELPLPPDLTPKDRAGLQELAARVGDLTAAGKRTDNATLYRFLKARKGDVAAAEAYFRKSRSFREELKTDEMDTHWNLEAYERLFAPWWCRGGLVGTGLNGQPVGLERLGRSRFPEILAKVPWDVIQRLDALFIVRLLAAFEEDAMARGRPLGGNTLILDLEGMSMDFCKLHNARSYGKLIENRDMLLPCTIGNILVIRAPKFFSLAWRLAGSFIDDTTREKVQVASSAADSLALMRKFVSDDVIPAYLGGRLHIEGDPDCRLLLGTSSLDPIPDEAIKRLVAEAARKRSATGAPAPDDSDVRMAKAREMSCCIGPVFSLFGRN